MLYDRHLMQALYQLEIGNPGSSFAVEIARKIGIPEDVIADATELVGVEYINADKYLQDIVRDKRYWEQKRQQIRKREKQMEETIAKYEAEMAALERNRKEILKSAKEDAERILTESNAKIENTIRTIKEAQAEKERTRAARQELAAFRADLDEQERLNKAQREEEIARKMERLKAKQDRKKNKKNGEAASGAASGTPSGSGSGSGLGASSSGNAPKVKPIEAGETVRIKGQTSVGEVTAVNGKNAQVTFGNLKTTVALARLERAAAPTAAQKPIAKSTFVSAETQDRVYEKKLAFKQDIDVRGMRGDEAIQAVTYFIDDAILLGINRVRILHGTGSGILRTLIRDYLSGVPGVAHFQDEHVQFGGAGITVVDLE
jgi:DNA mismatch repair protein MutS2